MVPKGSGRRTYALNSFIILLFFSGDRMPDCVHRPCDPAGQVSAERRKGVRGNLPPTRVSRAETRRTGAGAAQGSSLPGQCHHSK